MRSGSLSAYAVLVRPSAAAIFRSAAEGRVADYKDLFTWDARCRWRAEFPTGSRFTRPDRVRLKEKLKAGISFEFSSALCAPKGLEGQCRCHTRHEISHEGQFKPGWDTLPKTSSSSSVFVPQFAVLNPESLLPAPIACGEWAKAGFLHKGRARPSPQGKNPSSGSLQTC